MIESALDVGGGVFWTASEFTDRDKLKAGLVLLGLDQFVADPRPPAIVLKDAMEEALGGSRVLVRPRRVHRRQGGTGQEFQLLRDRVDRAGSQPRFADH